jgi:outer membrane protein OmpA-like peptidoglycan-associated protein
MIQRVLVLLLLSAAFGFPTTLSYAQVTVVNERGINTAFEEYSPAFYQQGLIFIASNPAVNKNKKEDTQLGKPTTSIFWAKRGNDGNLQRPITFAEELTTKFYDGPLSFNAEGDVVFFTRTNLNKGKPKAGKDGKVKLKIYTAKRNPANGKWQFIEPLPFNSNDFDCMHPSVSADGQQLYFASNRPGGKGGLDIYVSVLKDGKWGMPTNLGSSVNTAKDEVTPFIHADNTLYFASKGRKAFGGIDIFWTKKTDEGWLEPTAMPEPINTPSDDFGLIVSEDKKTGFFSSNRSSGQGGDDIFSFTDKDLDAQKVKEADVKEENPTSTKPSKSEQRSVDATQKREKDEVKIDSREVDLATQESTPAHAPTPILTTDKNENTNTVSVDISTIDKTTNLPITDVIVSVLNMKSIKNATFMTDATGKVTGLRAESGANIPIDILPSQEVTTDVKGNVTLTVEKGERFLFNFSKTGYDSKYIVKTVVSGDSKVAAFMMKATNKNITVNRKGLNFVRDTPPRPRITRALINKEQDSRITDFDEHTPDFEVNDAVGGDNYAFELKSRYYGQDDAEVNEEAKTELEPLLKMMQKDKRIEIEIASHTDARGKANFNMTISQLRADNIKTYFIENNIAPNRIRSLGYGETMIRNRCKRGVNCSNEEHAFNQRTDIKVVKGLDTETIVESDMPSKPKQQPTKVVNTEGADLVASNVQNTQNLVAPSSTREVSSKKYYVIVGTFTKPENAQKHRQKAIEAGFVEAEVIQYQDTYLYGVSVRLLNDAKEARKLADYINNQKIFEAFIKESK